MYLIGILLNIILCVWTQRIRVNYFLLLYFIIYRWLASRTAVFPAKRGFRSFSTTAPKRTHLNFLLIFRQWLTDIPILRNRTSLLKMLWKLLKLKLKISPFVSLKHDTNGPVLYHGQPMPSTSGYQRRSQQQGECYGCGSFQHWRSQCPFNPRTAMPKPK